MPLVSVLVTEAFVFLLLVFTAFLGTTAVAQQNGNTTAMPTTGNETEVTLATNISTSITSVITTIFTAESASTFSGEDGSTTASSTTATQSGNDTSTETSALTTITSVSTDDNVTTPTTTISTASNESVPSNEYETTTEDGNYTTTVFTTTADEAPTHDASTSTDENVTITTITNVTSTVGTSSSDNSTSEYNSTEVTTVTPPPPSTVSTTTQQVTSTAAITTSTTVLTPAPQSAIYVDVTNPSQVSSSIATIESNFNLTEGAVAIGRLMTADEASSIFKKTLEQCNGGCVVLVLKGSEAIAASNTLAMESAGILQGEYGFSALVAGAPIAAPTTTPQQHSNDDDDDGSTLSGGAIAAIVIASIAAVIIMIGIVLYLNTSKSPRKGRYGEMDDDSLNTASRPGSRRFSPDRGGVPLREVQPSGPVVLTDIHAV